MGFNRRISLFMFLIFLGSCFALFFSVSCNVNAETITYLDSNFDDYEGSSSSKINPTDWSLFNFKGGSDYTIGDNTHYGNSANSIKFVSNTLNNQLYINKSYSKNPVTNKVVLEASVMFEDTLNERQIFQLKSGSIFGNLLIFQSDGRILVNKSTYLDYNYKSNTWYNIKIILDNPSGIFDLYINDKLECEDLSLKSGWTNLTNVKIQQKVKTTAQTAIMYVDDVKIYDYVQPVSGVSIQSNLTLQVEESAQLQATIVPEDAVNKNITWTSENKEMATVDQNGIVLAKGIGTTNIVVTTEDGGYTTSCVLKILGIPIESLSIDKTLSVTKGNSVKVISAILPDNATNKNIIWSSNNKSIATVNSEGVIQGIEEGTVTITATTEDGLISDNCIVTVTSEDIVVKSINLPDSVTTYIGQGIQLLANVLPANATNKKVLWSVDSKNVATINENGYAVGLGAGTATITVTSQENNNITTSCVIQVKPRGVEQVSIDKENEEVFIGKNIDLVATIVPSNATNKNITWISSNPDVATVNQDGTVTAISQGTTTITVNTEDGNKTDSCLVNVKLIPNVDNGSFEKTENTTDIQHWPNGIKAVNWNIADYKTYNKVHGLLDKGIKYLDNQSLKFEMNDSRGFTTQIVDEVVPYQTYKISAYIKTENITANGINIRIQQLDENYVQIPQTQYNLKKITGTNDWMEVSGEFVTAPNISKLKIVIVLGTGGSVPKVSGTLWIDDLKLQAIIPVTDISFDSSNASSVKADEAIKLNTNIQPIYTSNKTISWLSSDESIATVDQIGNVTGVKPGQVNITAISSNPTVKATCTITVEPPYTGDIPVKSITLDKNKVTVDRGRAIILTPEITPVYATNQQVEWESSDSSIATVENGIVKTHKEGNVVITAKAADNKSYDCQVTVLPYEETEYDKLRERWAAYILGGDTYDLNDSQIKNIVDEVSQVGQDLWDDMNKSSNRLYLWSDTADKNTPKGITTNYRNLVTMSKAFIMEGSRLKDNPELLKDIISGLEWMYKNRYNQSFAPYSGNWWHWEIGAPQALNNVVTILYDYLSDEQIKKYMDVIYFFQPDPIKAHLRNSDESKRNDESVGGNRVDTAKVAVVMGIITKDANQIAMGRDALGATFDFVTTGDGLYTDWSFIQHNDVPYTATYGNVLLGGIAQIVNLLSDSTWKIVDEDINNIYDMILNSFQPLIYKGLAMDMVCGRAISRGEYQDHGIGHSIIDAILLYSSFAPKEYSDKYKSMVKYWIQQDTHKDYIETQESIQLIKIAKDLLTDTSIIPRGELTGHFRFPNMDRVVHRNKDFALGLSMYSNRTQSYEDMNNENRKGYHTGDGMTYLYNDDLAAYSDDFWATVDPYRLAGTTVDTKVLADGAGELNSPRSWVGGTSIRGLYGVAGMYLDKRNKKSTGEIIDTLGMDLKGKKSWFMFDNEEVALGAGINSTNDRTIETIVENRKIKDTGDNILTINGIEQPINLGCNTTIENVKWAHLKGNVDGSDIGYYFPGNSKLNALREARTGKWSDINYSKSKDEVTRNYVTMWFDHGKSPVNATYEYVLLPNMSSEQVEAYAQNPQITILANTNDVQAVKENNLNIIGANFWNDTHQTVDKISVDKKSAIMLKESDDFFEVSVSDPTMENDGVINVEIDGIAYDVLVNNPNITVHQLQPTIKFSVNVAGAKGAQFEVKFRKTKVSSPDDNSDNNNSNRNSNNHNSDSKLDNTISDSIKEIRKIVKKHKNEQQLEKAINESVQKTLNKIGTTTIKPTKRTNGKCVVLINSLDIKKKVNDIIDTANRLDKELKNHNLNSSYTRKITIKVDSDLKKNEVKIPMESIKFIQEKGINVIKLNTGIASIALKPETLINEESIYMSINLEDATSDLMNKQKLVIGKNKVYDFKVVSRKKDGSSRTISNFKERVNISIPYELLDGQDYEKITVYYISDDGQLENKVGKYDPITKTVNFKTDHFSKYMIKYNEISFDDVADNHWAKHSIEVLASKGIINGVDGIHFMPKQSITRAEFAKLITIALGQVNNNNDVAINFSDVKTSDWYYKYVVSCANERIITGKPDGSFDPSDTITRQDMAVMILRALQLYYNEKKIENLDRLDKFVDKNDVNEYALKDMSTAITYGLISGKGDSKIDPKGNTSRAEAATVIYRLFNY